MNTEDRQAAAFDTGRTQDPEIGSFLHKFAAMEEEHERMTWVPKK